jgi:glycosyltransferase involved in cell wall biosynthesis
VDVLLLNQFYPPDLAPTGRFLGDLAANLAARGHRVRVICSVHAYAGQDAAAGAAAEVAVERVGGTRFGRRHLPGRALDALSYAVGAWRSASRGPAPAVVVSLTSPPLLGLLGRMVAWRRGARLAHWAMDLYPDALVAAGVVGRSGAASILLGALSRAQYRHAALVVALGPRALERVAAQLPAETRREWLPLWGRVSPAAPEAAAAERARRGWSGQETVLLYSGNAGLAHAFGDFLAAAGRLGRSGPLWVFAGAGPRRGELERFAAARPDARIQLRPYVPEADLAATLCAADVHLVSLASGWQGVSVPSKLAAAFAVGRPVLFVGPGDSEPADWVRESGGGWCVEPGDGEALLAAVDAARCPEQRRERGRAAAAWAARHLERERGAARLAALVEACARRG